MKVEQAKHCHHDGKTVKRQHQKKRITDHILHENAKKKILKKMPWANTGTWMGFKSITLSKSQSQKRHVLYHSTFLLLLFLDFPGGSDGKELACSAEDLGLIPGLGWPLEEGMATHSSILAWRIPMDKGAWQATVYRVANNQTRLSTAQHIQFALE